MNTLDIVFLIATIGSYFLFVWFLSVFDERFLERRR